VAQIRWGDFKRVKGLHCLALLARHVCCFFPIRSEPLSSRHVGDTLGTLVVGENDGSSLVLERC
jgi:hypothetical protein